jgi:hypothetical protein
MPDKSYAEARDAKYRELARKGEAWVALYPELGELANDAFFITPGLTKEQRDAAGIALFDRMAEIAGLVKKDTSG